MSAELLKLVRELRWAVLHLANTGDGCDERIIRALRKADRVLAIKSNRPRMPRVKAISVLDVLAGVKRARR